MARILLVEDDVLVVTIVEEALTSSHHIVESVTTGPEGLDRLLHYHYDLAIVDWGLPGMAGIEICDAYRNQGGRMPILFLTGQSDLQHKVKAFDTGADDYLCKPFSFFELVARVNALLRRPPEDNDQVLEAGNLKVDLIKSTVSINGEVLTLTAREFDLLKLLMSNPGHVFTPANIVDKICPEEPDQAEQAIRQRVMWLRKKLMDHADSIVTVKGQGYKFEARKD